LRTVLLALAIATTLLGLACGSDSPDVATLEAGAATTEFATPEAVADIVLTDEDKVMAFTRCMQDQGIEYQDPVVDSKGNVQSPQIAEGVVITRAELAEPYRECFPHIEGMTFGRERPDVSAQVDRFVLITTCLRGEGFDVDDPTIDTFSQWGADFRVEFDWDNPKAQEAYETCTAKADEE
jgi:hypothetical protein